MSEPRIYREVAFDVPTFDLLKDWQRRIEAQLAVRLTNSDVLRALLLALPRP